VTPDTAVASDGEATSCDLDEMLAQAARYYGPSIDFSRVTVHLSRVSVGRRPWTANNTIRLVANRGRLVANRGRLVANAGRLVANAGRRVAGAGPDAGASLATLVHELAHVWQYQNGNLQLWRGVVEQVNYRLGRNPYDYGGAGGVRAAVLTGRPLTSFSNESQAQILEDHWSALNVTDATGYRNEPFTADYVDDLRTLVEGAGIGTRLPAGANPVETAAGRIVNRVAGWLEPVMGAWAK
jgi:hypothetical protein